MDIIECLKGEQQAHQDTYGFGLHVFDSAVEEITSLRQQLADMTQERDDLRNHRKMCGMCDGEALAAMTQERDQAIAHDRQPYPTAWAYEQACKSLSASQAYAAQLREALMEFPDSGEYFLEHMDATDIKKAALALPQDNTALRSAQEDAYLKGFMASGEGWNGEYPFQDRNENPLKNEHWIERRANELRNKP